MSAQNLESWPNQAHTRRKSCYTPKASPRGERLPLLSWLNSPPTTNVGLILTNETFTSCKHHKMDNKWSHWWHNCKIHEFELNTHGLAKLEQWTEEIQKKLDRQGIHMASCSSRPSCTCLELEACRSNPVTIEQQEKIFRQKERETDNHIYRWWAVDKNS